MADVDCRDGGRPTHTGFVLLPSANPSPTPCPNLFCIGHVLLSPIRGLCDWESPVRPPRATGTLGRGRHKEEGAGVIVQVAAGAGVGVQVGSRIGDGAGAGAGAQVGAAPAPTCTPAHTRASARVGHGYRE